MSTIKVDTIATRTGSGDITSSNNVSLADNTRIKLGTGDDIQIYNDGSYSRIMESGGTGLVLDTTSTDTRLTSDNSKVMGKFIKDGAVQLFHNNSQKLSTASTGVVITGGIGLGGTGAANTLDDYEEGTHTITFTNIAANPTSQSSTYTKIGNVVNYIGTLQFPSTSDNNNVNISLPFASTGRNGIGTFLSNGANDKILFTAGTGLNFMRVYPDNSFTQNNYSSFSNMTFYFTITYQTTA